MPIIKTSWYHVIPRHLVLLLLLGIGRADLSGGQLPAADESQVRAMMIGHLTNFVDWPPTRSDPHSPFIICVADNDQVGADLEVLLANRSTHGRPVVIRRNIVLEQAEQCHIFYWAHPKHNTMDKFLPALLKASVLTVSEESAEHSSMMIGLPLGDTHISIEINRSMAQRANLALSSRLLQIAAESR